MWMKILAKFAETRLKFVVELNINNIWWIPSIRKGKSVVSGGGGETTERLPNRENCRRKLVLSSGGIYFRKRDNSHEYLVNIWGKVHFIKKSQQFLKIFSKFSLNFVQTRKVLHPGFLNFRYLMEINTDMLVILNSYTIFSWFSPKFANIFLIFPIVFLDISQFWHR